jgi:bifunctional non-homologous end joining protein LigD
MSIGASCRDPSAPHLDPRATLSSLWLLRPSPASPPAIPTLVAPFHRPGWIYEEKVDGWRIVAYKDGADVQLLSRTGRDHTARFPGVAIAIAQLPAKMLILDGKVAVFDEQLVSRFDRIGGTSPDERITPPIFIVFDVL